jgi:VIT1/CCC1 family predicted Fe2+/Mn2+ transporter
VEDALVSTVGVLFGIATSGQYTAAQTVLTGLIVVAVESLSMGTGSFLSEESVHEVAREKDRHKDNSLTGATIMFFSYFLAGAATVAPYAFLEVNAAKFVSVGIATALLFVLGLVPKRRARDGVKMVLVAGCAALVGYLIGQVDASKYLG